MTLEEKLSAAEARLAEQDTQLVAAQASIASLQQQVSEAVAARESATACYEQAKQDLAREKSSTAALQTQVDQLQAAAKTAEAKAAEICASVGVEPLPVTAQGDRPSMTDKEWAEYIQSSSSGVERTQRVREYNSRNSKKK